MESGDRIGAWTVEQALGGSVWLCHHHEHVGRRAAVRVLHETEAHELRGEAALLTQLDHPALARVLEAQPDAEPPHVVMAWVEGESLAARLEHGVLPEEEVVAIAALLADGLARLHARGASHRDVRVENVRFGPDGPRLVGLLATHEGRRRRSAAALRSTPPEALGGEETDPRRWDVYGLGVLVYQALTAREPFPVPAEAQRRAQTLRTLKLASPHLDPGEGVSERLREAVRGMTASDPAKRIATATQALRALRGVQTGGAITLPPAVPVVAPDSRRVWLGVLVVLVLLGSALAFALSF